MNKNKFAFSKIKRKILSHAKLVRYLILGLILVVILLIGVFTYKALAKSVIGKGVAVVRDFLIPSTNRILTEDGRINVLILGKAGPGRGDMDAEITDTMILASVSTVKKKITLISIPRDIWIPSLTDKINSAYYYGKQTGGVKTGMILARSAVKEVLGIQSDYTIIIDFSSFKDIIDTLGGIEVNVKNSFTDSQYPIAGKENDNCNGDTTFACRYITITFNSGVQTMNGERALEFVRSRHASGIEFGDIAREARQQLVIAGIIKKALTPQIFTNLKIDKKILDIISAKIMTDMKPGEMATLARFAIDGKTNLKSYTIPDNLLYHPLDESKYFNNYYPYAWVFIPAKSNGSWTDVNNWANSVLP